MAAGAPRPECSTRGQGQRLGSPAGMGSQTVTERRPGSWGHPNRPGMDATLLCFSMIQRLLGASGWGFSLALSDQVGGEKTRKKERSNFSSPQLPWVCAANCHCETSIVRLSLPLVLKGSARGQGLH